MNHLIGISPKSFNSDGCRFIERVERTVEKIAYKEIKHYLKYTLLVYNNIEGNMNERLFDYLNQYYQIHVILDGDVKSQYGFSFGCKGKVYTAIFHESMVNTIKPLSFRMDFLDVIHQFNTRN